ncbi:MAG: signal peptidase II [Dehalococcoidia bacterium]
MLRISSLKWRQSGVLFCTAVIVVTIDQITKFFVRSNMDLSESIPAEGRFRLTYSTNSGSIFGLSLDATFLLVMAPVIIMAILWLYFYYLPPSSRFLRCGLGLLLGGAIGNLIDRFRAGEVTDFIDIRLWGDFHWAAFNVADAAITAGIVMVIYYLIHELRSQP